MNTKKSFCIETKRLRICEFTQEMAEAVHLNSLDEDNRRFVPDEVFETVEEAKEAVDFLAGRYGSADGPFVYPVLLKTGENIGHVQLAKIEEGWEAGYHIAKAHTGRGYATEALRAFLPAIAEKLQLSIIYGICLAENEASVRVMEKCGFELLYRGPGNYQGQEREIVKNVWHARILPTYEEAAAAIPPVRYRHFKGRDYEVITVARHSETEEPMVVYRALYGEGGIWCRPAAMWNDTVVRDGKTFRRFCRLDRIERVEKYERLFEEVTAAPDDEKTAALEAYYTSGEWRGDYEADERGEFPPDMKRGVLSQDALYDLLEQRTGSADSSGRK